MRRRFRQIEPERDDGPFVSFTDLFIGILFLFLILVATLMLLHQEAVQAIELEAQAHQTQTRQLTRKIARLETKLDTAARLDADHPPFRLAIVYNTFQRPADGRSDWLYSRTVQVYRTPNGLCLSNVILRNNLSLAWKPPVTPDKIPTAQDQDFVRMGAPCSLTAAGERWNTATETGGVTRVSPTLYSGVSLLHKRGGNEPLEIQYRVLGVYDRHFRAP